MSRYQCIAFFGFPYFLMYNSRIQIIPIYLDWYFKEYNYQEEKNKSWLYGRFPNNDSKLKHKLRKCRNLKIEFPAVFSYSKFSSFTFCVNVVSGCRERNIEWFHSAIRPDWSLLHDRENIHSGLSAIWCAGFDLIYKSTALRASNYKQTQTNNLI